MVRECEGREEFVRPLGGRHSTGIAGRHAYVRDFVVCVYNLISSSY